PFTMRLKLPADYRLEPHRHPAVERVTVLSGTLYFAQGEQFDRDQAKPIPPGGFAVMLQGTAMYGYTEEDTVLQLHGTGPWGIEYVNPEDDPRNQTELGYFWPSQHRVNRQPLPEARQSAPYNRRRP